MKQWEHPVIPQFYPSNYRAVSKEKEYLSSSYYIKNNGELIGMLCLNSNTHSANFIFDTFIINIFLIIRKETLQDYFYKYNLYIIFSSVHTPGDAKEILISFTEYSSIRRICGRYRLDWNLWLENTVCSGELLWQAEFWLCMLQWYCFSNRYCTTACGTKTDNSPV